MRDPKDAKLNERLQKAAEAKKAILEKMRSRPGLDDPEVVARRAEQERIARERTEREQARKEAKVKAEAEAKEAAEREAAEREAAAKQQREEEARQATELAMQQKAARDARYAARKARKK